MVASAHVGHHRDIAVVKCQAFAQHAAAGSLQHGRVDIWVVQHVACALGAAAVAGIDAMTAHVHAVGIGHAHAQTLLRQQMGDQSHRGGFSVGPRHGDHRDAPVVARLEQAGEDGPADLAAFAERRIQMHAQPRRGVDFHHAAALLFQRAQNAFADHVDTTDMQTHHLSCGHGAGCHLGVHIVGHVGGGTTRGQVGVVTQVDAPALIRNRICIQALFAQTRQRNIIKPDFGQRRGVAVAAARVLVHPFDQLRHRVHAVARHRGRIAPGCRHQPVAHHQQTEIIARHKALDQHLVPKAGRHRIGCS